MTIKTKLKVNSIVTALCVLSGTGMVITGLATTGSRIDRQEFCFKPEPVYQIQKIREYVPGTQNYRTKKVKVLIPYKEKYCQGSKLYIGVSWRIAEKIDANPELRKIHFKHKLPAKRPLSGWLTLTGAGLYLVGWVVWNEGSKLYWNNLQRIIKQKEQEVIEQKLIAQKDIELLSNRYSHETEFTKELQDREHGSNLSKLMGEGEKLYHQDVAQKKRELVELQHDLRKANTKALTAEEKEKEAKHLLEVEKLRGKMSDPWDEPEKSDLKTLLKEHEGGWIWDLVDSTKPVVIWGESGSYKSYTAACVVLLKHHFIGANLESIADPQWHQNRKAAWKELLTLEPKEYGEESNWEGEADSYRCAIEDLLGRCKERDLNSEPIISVWDELTKLGHYLPETAKGFMPEVISSPRKANEHTILLTHALTKTGLGGVEGMSEAIKNGTFRLQLKGNNQQKPSFKGKLDGWLNADGDLVEDYAVTLPSWFRVEKIKEMISGK